MPRESERGPAPRAFKWSDHLERWVADECQACVQGKCWVHDLKLCRYCRKHKSGNTCKIHLNGRMRYRIAQGFCDQCRKGEAHCKTHYLEAYHGQVQELSASMGDPQQIATMKATKP